MIWSWCWPQVTSCAYHFMVLGSDFWMIYHGTIWSILTQTIDPGELTLLCNTTVSFQIIIIWNMYILPMRICTIWIGCQQWSEYWIYMAVHVTSHDKFYSRQQFICSVWNSWQVLAETHILFIRESSGSSEACTIICYLCFSFLISRLCSADEIIKQMNWRESSQTEAFLSRVLITWQRPAAHLTYTLSNKGTNPDPGFLEWCSCLGDLL